MRTFGGLPDPLQMLRTVLICPLCPFPRICFELVGWPVFQKELQQECFFNKVVRQDHSRFSETHYLGTLSSVGISGPNAGALSATAVSVVQSLAVS